MASSSNISVCLCRLTRNHTGVCAHPEHLFFLVSLDHLKACRTNRSLQLAKDSPLSVFTPLLLWHNCNTPPVTASDELYTPFIFDWVHSVPRKSGAYKYWRVGLQLRDNLRALGEGWELEMPYTADEVPYMSCMHTPKSFKATPEGPVVRRATFRILVDISIEFSSRLLDLLEDKPAIGWQRDLKLVSYDQEVVANAPLCAARDQAAPAEKEVEDLT